MKTISKRIEEARAVLASAESELQEVNARHYGSNRNAQYSRRQDLWIAEKRVRDARGKLGDVLTEQADYEVLKMKVAKERGWDPETMEPPAPPAPEMSDAEWDATYKVDPALVQETVKEVMADIKALCAPPPPEPSITDDPSDDPAAAA